MAKLAAPLCFITTCKGRLDHLKETLPLLTEVENTRCVVVDYGCPQKSGDWVRKNFPDVHVEFTSDDNSFCLSRARNKGAAVGESEWLCFIDADIRITQKFHVWLSVPRKQNAFYHGGVDAKDTWGTMVCHRDAFNAVNGYDEVFGGWGGEDDDIYLRLRDAGGFASNFPAGLFDPIKHNDIERTKYHAIKDIDLQTRINFLYLHIKADIRHFSPTFLSIDGRRSIMAEATKAVLSASAGGTNAHFDVELAAIPGVPQPVNWVVKRRLNYEITPRGDIAKPKAPPVSQRPVSADDDKISVGNGVDLEFVLKVIPSERTRALANEIFLGKCYAVPLLSETPKTIVDIGADVGLTAAYFRLTYPMANIYCFESDSVKLAILHSNVATIGKAVVNPQESTSHATGSATALDALAFLPQIDILKLSSAASNLPILSSLRPRLSTIQTLYVEFSSVETRDRTTALLGEVLRTSHTLWKVQALTSDQDVHGVLIYVQKADLGAND